MVGNTGRKCSSQGINVIWGGSQCMGNPYKALLSPKSRKIRRRIQLIVSKYTHGPHIRGLVVPTGTTSASVAFAPQQQAISRFCDDPLSLLSNASFRKIKMDGVKQ